MDQAIARQDQDLAMRADQLFAEGYLADPNYEPNPLQRLILHRDHGALVPNPMDATGLLELATTARDVWPRALEGKLQYTRTLLHIGDRTGAETAFRELALLFPGAPKVERLSADMGIAAPEAGE